MRRLIAVVLLVGFWGAFGLAEPLSPLLPNKPDSLKFAVIGDNGTGDTPQYEVGRQMAVERGQFAFEIVLMVGDNFYGGQGPSDLVKKFDRPYKPLLDAGVTFHAVLGNHDDPRTINYPPLNMNGQRYYTFTRKNARFFMLDSNSVDRTQMQWFERAVMEPWSGWKICIFHHPLYSNAGRHGSAVDIRVLLEPILIRAGVDVVFSGHDHSYERLKPQNGIHYFVTGSGGKLRRGDIQPSDSTAAAFDQDQAFVIGELDGDSLLFEAVSRTGARVDSGAIRRRVSWQTNP